MVPNILSAEPPDPGEGVNRSNSTFFEHDHFAYQIKGNHEI